MLPSIVLDRRPRISAFASAIMNGRRSHSDSRYGRNSGRTLLPASNTDTTGSPSPSPSASTAPSAGASPASPSGGTRAAARAAGRAAARCGLRTPSPENVAATPSAAGSSQSRRSGRGPVGRSAFSRLVRSAASAAARVRARSRSEPSSFRRETTVSRVRGRSAPSSTSTCPATPCRSRTMPSSMCSVPILLWPSRTASRDDSSRTFLAGGVNGMGPVWPLAPSPQPTSSSMCARTSEAEISSRSSALAPSQSTSSTRPSSMCSVPTSAWPRWRAASWPSRITRRA